MDQLILLHSGFVFYVCLRQNRSWSGVQIPIVEDKFVKLLIIKSTIGKSEQMSLNFAPTPMDFW